MTRWFLLFGLLTVALGLVLHFDADIPYLTPWIGRLPGDIVIHKGHLTLYVPAATSFVASVVLSLLFFRSSKR